MPTLLAHGLLGQFDEIIYLGIAVVFIGFMALSWIRSRNQVYEDEVQDDSAKEADAATAPDESTDHFTLS